MRYLFSFLLVLLTTFPASASDPGEPLDCSDWVFLEPGISCQVAVTPCSQGADQLCGRGANLGIDNRGRCATFGT